MKAVFLKELREGTKWALAIFGVLGMLVLFEIRKANPFIIYQLDQQKLVFFAPLAGLLMGIAQSFFEARSDNWAFVVHRPLSRRALFTAKCSAGLLLLYLSLALPCLLAAAWAAQPGNVATPFHWRALVPMLADILNAGSFYFAGIVVTLHKARWFGSRLLPLGLGVGTSFGLVMMPDFWQAAAIALVGLTIGGLAAWNVFASGGTAERGGAPRLALGAMIFAGAVGIGCLFIDLAGVLGSSVIWHDLRLDRDGTALRVSWRMEGSERTCIITDAEGKPVAKYEGIDVNDPANADRFVQFSNVVFDDRFVPWPYSMDSRGYRKPDIVRLRAVANTTGSRDTAIASNPGGQVIATSVANNTTRVPFICVLDAQDAIIKLYDPVTHTLLGSVGPTGSSFDQAQPGARFPGKPLNLFFQANNHTLAFATEVYWLELDHRRVRRLFTAQPDDPVISACEIRPQNDPRAVLLTRNQLRVMKPSGETVLAVPFNLDTRKLFFQFAVLPSNGHFVVRAVPLPGEDAENPQQILEYTSDGKLARHTKIAQLADDVSPTALRRTATVGAVWPPVLLPLYTLGNLDYVFETDYRRCRSLLVRWLLVTSLLCGAGTRILCRRFGFGRGKTLAWIVTNLLLGPAGVVVMLSLNDWPAREVCAACGKSRLVGRRECTSCGAALPPPALDGREIFEPEGAFQGVGPAH